MSLADKDLSALRSEVARWCREHSPRLVPKYSSLAYRLFDRVLNLLLAAGDESTTSALGDPLHELVRKVNQCSGVIFADGSLGQHILFERIEPAIDYPSEGALVDGTGR